jgi:DNA ligase-1
LFRYQERIEYLKELKSQGKFPAYVRIVDLVKCNGNKKRVIFLTISGKSHLKEFFEQVISKGGEGVMLREPQSLYKAGRSPSLRKFKPFFDTEVKVLENNFPHGFECAQ